MMTTELANDVTGAPPVGISAWLADDGDTQWQCTVCGRIGTVGRCCGFDTRIPLNDLARQEEQRIMAANDRTEARGTERVQ